MSQTRRLGLPGFENDEVVKLPTRRCPPDDFELVGAFHELFGLRFTPSSGAVPNLIDDELVLFRLRFLREELDELIAGYGCKVYPDGDIERDVTLDQNLEVIADSLVDLVYVTLGTAHLHWLPWNDLFREVHRANMTKVRAATAADSARGSAFDVVKPHGWQAPRIRKVLLDRGWKP